MVMDDFNFLKIVAVECVTSTTYYILVAIHNTDTEIY